MYCWKRLTLMGECRTDDICAPRSIWPYYKREEMIFLRSSDKLGQAATSRAKIGSQGFCESPCESGLASA
jgi:hypothetical protein